MPINTSFVAGRTFKAETNRRVIGEGTRDDLTGVNRRNNAGSSVKAIEPGFTNSARNRFTIPEPSEFVFRGIQSAPDVTEIQTMHGEPWQLVDGARSAYADDQWRDCQYN